MHDRYAEITGLGAVSCFGQTASDLIEASLAGRDGIIDIQDIAPGRRFHMGAPVRGFDPEAHFDSRARATLDRFSQFGVVAAREAWNEAGLAKTRLDPHRIGVIVGTAAPGIDILADGMYRILRGSGRPLPTSIPMGMGNATASRIAKEIGAKGPVFVVTSACASAAHAVVLAQTLMRAGVIDIAVAGGAESCFCEPYLKTWDELRVLSPDACRPFSLGRRGLVMGEGAGMLILERAGRAAERGAKVRARILGGAMNCDAGELLSPDPEGMAGVMRLALTDGGVEAANVDYINAHGTGTVSNDVAESRAIHDVFGKRAEAIVVSSTKSQIGHALGASGALEAIATIAALEAGIVPPTLNVLEMDPACNLTPTPNKPFKRDLRVAISNSFAFGGLNGTLVFERTSALSP